MKSQFASTLPRYDGDTGVLDTNPVSGTEQPTAQMKEQFDESDGLVSLFGRTQSIPLDREQLPGIVRDYLDLTTKCTDAKPGVLLTSWLPFLAVNLGNRVFMMHNSAPIYPNIWSCVIGPSSISRKTTALRFADYTIAPYEDVQGDAELTDYNRNAMRLNGTTLAKLLSYLALNPNRIFVHNELSSWLNEMNRSFNAGYKQVVTEIFDGVSRTYATLERTERIRNPALSIAAATTEGWFFRNMRDGADQLSGFLQRMLFYVVRNVNVDDIDLAIREENDLRGSLTWIDEHFFSVWRSIPGSFQLRLSQEAKDYRNEVYEQRYRHYFKRNNDALMSYFTRIYDAYWFKFCTIFTLVWRCEELAKAIKDGNCAGFFEEYDVELLEAQQAMYLCNFYMENTTPFLAMMEEQDKLSGERRLVELLITKFGGKAGHTALMNTAHMKKREFMEQMENLIERGAVTVETLQTARKPGRLYVLDPRIAKTW